MKEGNARARIEDHAKHAHASPEVVCTFTDSYDCNIIDKQFTQFGGYTVISRILKKKNTCQRIERN